MKHLLQCGLKSLAILALLACPAKAESSHAVMIVNASAPASLTKGATSGVVYFSVMNHGATEDELLKVQTPRAADAQLHENIRDGDVVKMRDLKSLVVPAHGFVQMKPGATHLMLTGLVSPLAEGDVIPLELTFRNAGVVKLEVTVGKAAAAHVHGTGN